MAPHPLWQFWAALVGCIAALVIGNATNISVLVTGGAIAAVVLLPVLGRGHVGAQARRKALVGAGVIGLVLLVLVAYGISKLI